MRALRSRGGRVGIKLAVVSLVALSAALLVLTLQGTHSRIVAENPAKLEASILSYDGKDFVRTKTTLTDADGKSAVNTKLDHNSMAYKALVQKHSYVGTSEVFGKKYDADYAPLISDDGKLMGALFVGSPK